MNIAESNVFVQNRGSIMRGSDPIYTKDMCCGGGVGVGLRCGIHVHSVSKLTPEYLSS